MSSQDKQSKGYVAAEVVELALSLGSIARLARIRARRSRGDWWPRALLPQAVIRVVRGWRAFTYLWLILIAAAILWGPFPEPGFAPFDERKSAIDFLDALWQVEAAALALSLTIVVFAIQSYRSSARERYGGTLRRFIRLSYLQEGYELGVVALLAIGAARLGIGHGGADGSAGVAAAALAFASIAVLPLLLNSSLRTTHRDHLERDRTAQLTAAVREEVDFEVEARLAASSLRHLAEREEFQFLQAEERATFTERVPAKQSGFVTDVNLRRLIFLSRFGLKGRVLLTGFPGSFVGTDSPVLYLAGEPSSRQRRSAGKIVSVKPGNRREKKLRRYLEDLHDEAIAAIKAGGPAEFERIAESYVEALLAFPRSWRRYEQEYDVAVAQGIEFFAVTPVDEVTSQFHSNVVESLRSGTGEVLRTAAYLPFRVAGRALDYHADGLLEKMLSLPPGFLRAAWSHGGDLGRLLEDRARRHLIEFIRLRLEMELDNEDPAERERALKHTHLAFTKIQSMLRFAVDAGKPDFIQRLDGDWGGRF